MSEQKNEYIVPDEISEKLTSTGKPQQRIVVGKRIFNILTTFGKLELGKKYYITYAELPLEGSDKVTRWINKTVPVDEIGQETHKNGHILDNNNDNEQMAVKSNNQNKGHLNDKYDIELFKVSSEITTKIMDIKSEEIKTMKTTDIINSAVELLKDVYERIVR